MALEVDKVPFISYINFDAYQSCTGSLDSICMSVTWTSRKPLIVCGRLGCRMLRTKYLGY